MRQRLTILLFMFSLAHIACGQDINFSQFYELPLLRNPALAGIFAGDVRVTTAMRNQWGSVSVPYQTQALGSDIKFGVSESSNDYVAVGLQVTNDLAGDSKLGKTQLFPVLTYHKSLSSEQDSYLSLGFMGGAVSQHFDPSKLAFDDQFVNGAYSSLNPTRQMFNNTNLTYWDAAVGLLYSSVMGAETKFYIGCSYFHFTEPKVAFDEANDIRLNKKVMFNAGLSAPTSETDRLIVYADYFIQGGNRQGQGGFMFRHDLQQDQNDEAIALSAGGFLRWNDAVMPMLKLDYYQLGVGLTYDINMSKLKNASNMRGGFEITLSYRNFLNMRNSSAEKVRCPVGL